jgi:hypothetical protein
MTINQQAIDEKVRELLGYTEKDEEGDFGLGRPPPLVDVYSSRSGTPFSTPTVRRLLTPKQEQSLISRLYVVKKRPNLDESTFSNNVSRRMINPHSAKLAHGLEPIDVRTSKLIRAKERRMEKLVQDRVSEEDKHLTGQPEINPTSRRIAERLAPEDRVRMVEARRKILMEEARLRETENCWFRPSVNFSVNHHSTETVTDRLSRDAATRKAKQEKNERERVAKEISECKSPEITNVAKNIFRDLSVPPVHQRLYPPPASDRGVSVPRRRARSTEIFSGTSRNPPVYSYHDFLSSFQPDDYSPYPIQPVTRVAPRQSTNQDLSAIFSFTKKR